MAAPNASGQIRQAVLYDYVKNDLEETQKEGPQPDMYANCIFRALGITTHDERLLWNNKVRCCTRFQNKIADNALHANICACLFPFWSVGHD